MYKHRIIEDEMELVKFNGLYIRVLESPSEKVQLEAIKANPFAIDLIKNPSEKVQLAAVKKYGKTIKYIKDPSEKVQIEAVKRNVRAFKHIANPCEEVRLIHKEFMENVLNFYNVVQLGDVFIVGCANKTGEEWLNTTEKEIREEYGDKASTLLPSLKKIIRGE